MSTHPAGRRDKASAIIQQATLLFAEKGYNATTIDEIAERASVGKGTVYEYFKSKQDLFFAVFDEYMKQAFSQMESRVSKFEEKPTEELRRLMSSLVNLAEDARRLFPLTFEFWSASATAELRERIGAMFRDCYSMFRTFIAAIIRRGIEQGEFSENAEPEAVGAVLVGAIDGLFLQAWFDPSLDPAKLGAAFMEVLIRGLSKPPESAGENALR